MIRIGNVGDIYTTSDSHFWHENIIRFSKRPFSSITEMNQALISNWNERVRPEDTVYHLGDVAFCNTSKFEAIFNQLNGTKHLIRGNHDLKSFKGSKPGYFETIRDYHEMNINGQKLCMMHYPMHSWNRSHRGSYHIHGHRHGSLNSGDLRRMDVGVDANNYYPIHIDEVVQYMESKPLPYPPGTKNYRRE